MDFRHRAISRAWNIFESYAPRSVVIEGRRSRRVRERRRQFKRQFGRPVDLNNPQLFSEKLIARILADKPIPLYEVWDDKLTAPFYARQKTQRELHFPERLGVWDTAGGQILKELPRPFVVKLNFGSAETIVVDSAYTGDLDQLAERLNRRKDIAVNARGESYQAYIIAEEMLTDAQGRVPRDVKIHCFNSSDGEFRWLLQLDHERAGDHRQDIYLADGTVAPFTFHGMRRSAKPPGPPRDMDTFISVARDLSADFDYVRVDLYEVDGGVAFGEFTPCHRSGCGWIEPASWEVELGSWWEWRPEGYFAENLGRSSEEGEF